MRKSVGSLLSAAALASISVSLAALEARAAQRPNRVNLAQSDAPPPPDGQPPAAEPAPQAAPDEAPPPKKQRRERGSDDDDGGGERQPRQKAPPPAEPSEPAPAPAEPAPKRAPKAAPKIDVEPKFDAEPAPKAEPAPPVEPKPERKSPPKASPKIDLDPEPAPAPKPAPEPEPEPAPAPKAEPKPKKPAPAPDAPPPADAVPPPPPAAAPPAVEPKSEAAPPAAEPAPAPEGKKGAGKGKRKDDGDGDRKGKGEPQPEGAGTPPPASTPPGAAAPPPPPGAAEPAPPPPGAEPAPQSKSGAVAPPSPEAKKERAERQKKGFERLKQERREIQEDGGRRTVIEEPDKRRIIREDGRSIIRHDETERFRRLYRDSRQERGSDGSNITVVLRPGGIEIRTELDRDGRALRRWRRERDGREVVLFDNRQYYRRFGDQRPSFIDAIVTLPPPRVRPPRERYIVDYDRASDEDIYEVFAAEPIERLPRRYSLEEVRQSPDLRERMPRLDLDTITFDFGSWDVNPEEYARLGRAARIITRVLDRSPDEVFLIEGHTDAVGSDEDNLTLSDRRAESVAFVLSEEFGVPAENLATQGYGEHYLKIPTQAAERANRRVSMRRITPLLAR